MTRPADREPQGSEPAGDGEEPDPRWSLANERTLLAYVRTSLSLLVAGLAVAASKTVMAAPAWLAALGLPLLTMGAVVALSAKKRFITVQRAMRLGEPLQMPPLLTIVPWGIASVAAVGLVLTGIALASS